MSPFDDARLRALIAHELGCDVARVRDDVDLAEDLGADNLEMISLCMRAEDDFGISVTDEDIDGLATIGDLVALVKQKCEQRARAQ